MLTGKRFKLDRATIAVGQVDGKRPTSTIPVRAIFKVVSEPNREGMLDVNWTTKSRCLTGNQTSDDRPKRPSCPTFHNWLDGVCSRCRAAKPKHLN